MRDTRGTGDGSLPTKGVEALTTFDSVDKNAVGEKFLGSHRDTQDLRYIAERYRRRRKKTVENTVEFAMDPETGMIVVKIKDEVSGELQLKLSPEEVEKVLKGLEEAENNDTTLASFFIDVKL
jgi:uncharacterized FlaG/YvyC family protein